MRFWPVGLVVMAALVAAGCTIYVDSDDDGACVAGPPSAGASYRDPTNGVCRWLGASGLCGDESLWGDHQPPDWALCSSDCDDLAEDACRAAIGCRPVYLESCPQGSTCPQAGGPYFAACWGVAPSHVGILSSCEGFDANLCSRYHNCAAVYVSKSGRVDSGPWHFETCTNETRVEPQNLCLTDADCSSGVCVTDDVCRQSPLCGPASCDPRCRGTCAARRPPPGRAI